MIYQWMCGSVNQKRLPIHPFTHSPIPQTAMSPAPLSTILGQPQAVELLTQAVAKQRLAPAYLFCGAEGIGKSLAARCFIELLLCDRIPEAQHPLIQQKLRQGNYPDVMWISPTYLDRGKLLTAAEATTAGLKRKAPPQIRIEQIREIGQFLSRPPLLGSRSIVVIEQGETMPEGAANALLKTLEEPGQATIVILASSIESLLPTIVSRCQRVSFQRLDRTSTIAILTSLGRTDIIERPELLGLAAGSPGAAIDLWEQLQALPSDLLDRLLAFPWSRRQALELAATIDRELDGSAQLWILDYLQYAYWQKYRRPQLVEILERSRSHLLAYVQPRLVWECTLMELGSIELITSDRVERLVL
jgi:DNA polymerase III subunit delta'